jgi:hypothetical protein
MFDELEAFKQQGESGQPLNAGGFALPISTEILTLARELKMSGVDWDPTVGSFVWDHLGIIEAPSPFPLRVYFILNLKRFLRIFGTSESIKEQLVWLPTSFQLRLWATEHEIDLELEHLEDPEEEVVALYRALVEALRRGHPSEALGEDENENS